MFLKFLFLRKKRTRCLHLSDIWFHSRISVILEVWVTNAQWTKFVKFYVKMLAFFIYYTACEILDNFHILHKCFFSSYLFTPKKKIVHALVQTAVLNKWTSNRNKNESQLEYSCFPVGVSSHMCALHNNVAFCILKSFRGVPKSVEEESHKFFKVPDDSVVWRHQWRHQIAMQNHRRFKNEQCIDFIFVNIEKLRSFGILYVNYYLIVIG